MPGPLSSTIIRKRNGTIFDADKNVGEHLCFLAGVERIVHGFLNSGDNAARGGVEAKQVLVLLEEFRYTDAALLLASSSASTMGTHLGNGRCESDRLLLTGREVLQGHFARLGLRFADNHRKIRGFRAWAGSLGARPRSTTWCCLCSTRCPERGTPYPPRVELVLED